MTDELFMVLMDLVSLCRSNAMAIEQTLMLGVDGMSQPEKDKRTTVLEGIALVNDGCAKTAARIEAMRKP